MHEPTGGERPAELRDYLAEERTFLAWIRTGLALMGFGFVVARFGLFLQLMQTSHGGASANPLALSLDRNDVCRRRRRRASRFGPPASALVDELNHGQTVSRRPSHQAVFLALFLAAVGVVIALYLSLT